MPFDHLEGEVLQQLRNMMPITTRNPGKCKEVFTLLANNPPSNDYRKGAQWFEAFHITATKDFEALMESWGHSGVHCAEDEERCHCRRQGITSMLGTKPFTKLESLASHFKFEGEFKLRGSHQRV
ncbi:hypothetical protein FOL46_001012 [Perkinsus olseni]|uniref:Uncharacterized protein n=1 Tax=Perkinsus olseni TaxID=32597 RepID=A0A7J6MEX7_PEROL|nr:hypothetical protein FOL46_001012 [Perkinsus olseni]